MMTNCIRMTSFSQVTKISSCNFPYLAPYQFCIMWLFNGGSGLELIFWPWRITHNLWSYICSNNRLASQTHKVSQVLEIWTEQWELVSWSGGIWIQTSKNRLFLTNLGPQCPLLWKCFFWGSYWDILQNGWFSLTSLFFLSMGDNLREKKRLRSNFCEAACQANDYDK